MSCRQFGLLLACLATSVVAPSWVYAQSEEEPLPLLRGGFIQQLRSLPAELMKPLSGNDEPAEEPAPNPRGAARSPAAARGRFGRQTTAPQPAPAQSANQEAPQRPRQSPWLDRLNPAARDNRVVDLFEHRAEDTPPPPIIDRSGNDRMGVNRSSSAPRSAANNFAGEIPGKNSSTWSGDKAAGDYAANNSTSGGHLPSTATAPPTASQSMGTQSAGTQPGLTFSDRPRAAQPSLKFEPDAFETAPAKRSFAEVTGQSQGSGLSLQQAPRVSRVPLPRPASSGSLTPGNVPSQPNPTGDETPKRVPAIATSASPTAGTMRISSAALQSTLEETAGQSVRVPAQLLEATRAEQKPAPTAPPELDTETLSFDPPQGDSTASQTLADIQDESAGDASSTSQPVAPSVAPSVASSESKSTSRSSGTSSSDPQSTGADELRLPLAGDPSSLELELPSGPAATAANTTPTLPSLPSLPSLPNFPTDSSQPTRNSQSVAGLPPTSALQPKASTPPMANALPAMQESTRATAPHMPQLVTDNRRPTAQPQTAAPDQRLKMEAPRVQVILNGPEDMPIGSPARYEIVVRNDDAIDLQGLILRLDIPADIQVQALRPTHGQFEVERAPDGLTMLTWGFEYLAAGQSATAPMQLTATSAKNFAVAMEWTLMPIAGSSSLAVTAPRLELALEGPSEVSYGHPNVYRLHVRNPGNAVASGVTVQLSAEPYGSSAAEIPSIEPGEEEVIDVELTFNERGSISITANAKEQTGLSSHTAISVLVRQAKVQSQLFATEAVYHGSPTECRIRLSNAGDADATQLSARLQLPSGGSLLSAPTGASLVGRELTWPVPHLAAGKTEEFLVQLMLTGEGENLLQFSCNGLGNVNTTAQASTRVESITDLKLYVNDPIAPAPVGGDVVYELSLTNRGSKAATNVKVIAQFSEGIEPIRGEGQSARVIPGQTLFDPIARIGAGETLQLKIIAQAAAAGTHRFRVEVRSDESNVRLVQEESTQYLEGASRLAAPATRATLR